MFSQLMCWNLFYRIKAYPPNNGFPYIGFLPSLRRDVEGWKSTDGGRAFSWLEGWMGMSDIDINQMKLKLAHELNTSGRG